MSQYPSPYTPPPNFGYDFNYYQPQQDALGPAKRASIMLYVLGGLVLLPSLCCGGMGLALPAMMAQQPAAFSELSTTGMSPEAIQMMFVIGGIVGLFIGIMMIFLGRFVRRGTVAPAATALVLSALIVIYLVLNALGLMVMAGKMPQPQIVLGLAMTVVGLVIFGMLIMWLVQTIMAAPRVAVMQSQYQQQLWQYQQQQQAYQAAYGAQQQQQQPPSQTPPPPPTVPPPAPPDSGSPGDPNAPSA